MPLLSIVAVKQEIHCLRLDPGEQRGALKRHASGKLHQLALASSRFIAGRALRFVLAARVRGQNVS
jgi:hypothetical protein